MTKENSASTLTRKSYDASAHDYANKVALLHPKEEIKQFASMLPKQAHIIDVGCGPGRDAKIFSEQGLQVVGIDFSIEMIEIAKQTAPQATFYVKDIVELDFPKNSFHGIWANCSLLHVPKIKIPFVLNQFHNLLKEEGILYLSVKEGKGETIEKDPRYGNLEKFWSFFEEGELKNYLVKAGFVIIEATLQPSHGGYQTHSLIKILAKKLAPNIDVNQI